MDSKIPSFFDRLTIEDIIELGVCTDELFQVTEGGTYREYVLSMLINSRNGARPKDLFLEYIGPGLLTSTTEYAEELSEKFFTLPLEDMPLYIMEAKKIDAEKVSGICPPPEEGPLPWQTLLSRWRLRIQK
jgi:hypothetical protein